jgi:2-hydroxychromene-2-carboxylate isomerase
MRDDRRMTPSFFFSAMSPYSWLAAERIGLLIPTARWRPVFLGGIFKAKGRKSWGLDEGRAAGMADCEARAAAYGLELMRWPEPWPTNELSAARAMMFAQAAGRLESFALEAMRLAFREGADLELLAPILEAARRAGLDPAEAQAALADPEIKQALRAATDQALARGVFGVPTVIVAEQLYWGDDHLEQAAAEAAVASA